MVEITNSDGWTEVKGSDVLVKVIEFKKPFSVSTGTTFTDDDDDEDGENNNNNNNNNTTTGESSAEEIEKGPRVKLDDTILLNIIGRQANSTDHTDGPIVLQGKSWVVGVGDLDVLPKAVELGVQTLHAGDTAYIYSIPEYAFGGAGSIRKYKINITDTEYYTLPDTSGVLFQVEVIQIVADTSRLNPYFPIQKATTRKLIANDIYQHEWASGGKARERCIRLYEKIAKDMKKLLYDGTYFNSVEEDHPQKKQVHQLLIDALNNIVAVYISSKRYNKGRDIAYEIITKHDKNNAKAVIRYVKCCVYDSTCDDTTVQESFQKAETIITYKNPNEEEELKKLKQQYKRLRQQPK